MFYTVLATAALALGVGFVVKKEETIALLKNVVAWAVAVGTAAFVYFSDLDLSKFF